MHEHNDSKNKVLCWIKLVALVILLVAKTQEIVDLFKTR